MATFTFYERSVSQVEVWIASLLLKSLSKKWQSIVLCADREFLAKLDKYLWEVKNKQFLPHIILQENDDKLVQRALLYPIILSNNSLSQFKGEVFLLLPPFVGLSIKTFDSKKVFISYNGMDTQQKELCQDFKNLVNHQDNNIIEWKEKIGGGWQKQNAKK